MKILRVSLVIISLFMFVGLTQAATIHVPKDYPTIQQGIDAAIDGDTVLVADGTYKGISNRDLDYRGKAIIVTSENGAESTIIDCENLGRGFYFHSGETLKSVVSGFTVINSSSSSDYIGAICCVKSSPTIENNIITGNMGGGIYCNINSNPLIRKNIISNNTSNLGGGIHCAGSSPIIEKNIISMNKANEGGGIYCLGASPKIISNIINKNSAIENGGGIFCNYSYAIIVNSAIIDNFANNGGGLFFVYYSRATMINNTISYNSANTNGGGFFLGGGYAMDDITTITNSIFWGNKPEQIRFDPPSWMEVSYSNIQNGWAGEGNIETNPLFIDAKNGDYHLQDSSPCNIAGIMTTGVAVTDIDGNPRPNPSGSKPDMGCYENSYFPPIMSITSAEVLPSTQTKIQLSVTDAKGIASGDITISYDSNILSIVDIRPTDLTSNMNLTPNTEIQGQIKITMAGTTGIQSGSGSLVDITMSVNANAKAGSETKLHIVNAEIYYESGKSIPLKLEDGFVRIKQACVKGDVNDDGNIKSNDATLILRMAAGLLEPNDYQKCSADVNGDGNIRSNDAMIVLRKAAGLEAPIKDLIADRHISVSLSEAHGLKGETISVPITVDKVDLLSSGDMSISYDSKVLRAVDILSSDSLLMANNISQPGLIRISFAGVERLTDEKLAEIRFEVLTDNVSPLTFKLAELYGTDAVPLNSRVTNKQFRSWAVAPEYSVLLQNFPNPFNPETWIPYQLHEASEVVIRIHNIIGELVRELRLGYKSAGIYTNQDRSAYWDGRNEAGERVSSGVYFYNIQAGKYSSTMKMIVTK